MFHLSSDLYHLVVLSAPVDCSFDWNYIPFVGVSMATHIFLVSHGLLVFIKIICIFCKLHFRFQNLFFVNASAWVKKDLVSQSQRNKTKSNIFFVTAQPCVIFKLRLLEELLVSLSEAALQRCPYEKVFWTSAANLQENTHAKVWFQ